MMLCLDGTEERKWKGFRRREDNINTSILTIRLPNTVGAKSHCAKAFEHKLLELRRVQLKELIWIGEDICPNSFAYIDQTNLGGLDVPRKG